MRLSESWKPCPKLHGIIPRPSKPALLLLKFWGRGVGILCRNVRNEEETMNRDFFPDHKDEGEVIASWGEAKLIKHWDGGLELRGGSRDDQGEAREWLSMFWHEAVVGEVW